MAFYDILRKPYRIEITGTDDHWGHYRGYVFNAGSHYVIRIDRNLPRREQIEALKHEMGHIYSNHLVTPWIDRDKAEQEAQAKADSMTDETLKKLLQLATRIDYL